MQAVTQYHLSPEEVDKRISEAVQAGFSEYTGMVALDKGTVIGINGICSILKETRETVVKKFNAGEYDFITKKSERTYLAKVGDVVECVKIKKQKTL